ncbi:hypothetical protein FB451DRAFT_1195527 [Mycena latifolia]|nr:hypothetical protein FB451DRAFT_1195527 [Mycena latifolia]
MATQTILTSYFAIVPTPIVLHAPRPNGARQTAARLRTALKQSLLSQFFPNNAMYIGDLGSTQHLDRCRLHQLRKEHEEHRRIVDLNMRPEFLTRGPVRRHRVPQTNIQDPLPFPTPTTDGEQRINAQTVFHQAATAAPVLQALWADDYFARELFYAEPDVVQRHFDTADRAFVANLGPRATSYVQVHGVDGGSLHFSVLPSGNTVPYGPGLDGFNAAVAEDDAAAAEDDAQSSVVEDVPATSDDIFDNADAQSSVSSLSNLSSHDSMPSLIDEDFNDARPQGPSMVLDLSFPLLRRLQELGPPAADESSEDFIVRAGQPLSAFVQEWLQDVPESFLGD